jgi:hypothetical protein
MSFGFSIGDLIAGQQIMSKITFSLKEITGAGAEYQELIGEIESLSAALLHVEQLAAGRAPPPNLISIKDAVLSCGKPLEEFYANLRTYEKSVGDRSQSTATNSGSDTSRSAVGLKDEARRLRTNLHVHNCTIDNLLIGHALEKLDAPVTVINSQPKVRKKEKVVGFYRDPIESISRPVNTPESWACYHFEMHARKCAYCHNPYEVHRNHEQLCDVGHRLAQEVAK